VVVGWTDPEGSRPALGSYSDDNYRADAGACPFRQAHETIRSQTAVGPAAENGFPLLSINREAQAFQRMHQT
jgi:hypothetical protein